MATQALPHPRHDPRHALECAVDQFQIQQPRGIDGPWHCQPPMRNALESDARVKRFVADEDDERVSAGARGVERMLHQFAPDAAIAKRRIDRQRAEQQAGLDADADRRDAIGADEQGADARNAGQGEIRRDAFAQAIGRLRVTAGAEGAIVEPLDGGEVGVPERDDGEREIGHGD
jgi:hypothetical protein